MILPTKVSRMVLVTLIGDRWEWICWCQMVAGASLGLNTQISPFTDKILSGIESPVLHNMLEQAMSSAISGGAINFAFGFNEKNATFGSALKAGWKGFLQGAELGAISGAAAGFVEAKHNNVNPWTGKELDFFVEKSSISKSQTFINDDISHSFTVTPDGVVLPKEFYIP